jgi:hypothetical protein
LLVILLLLQFGTAGLAIGILPTLGAIAPLKSWLPAA